MENLLPPEFRKIEEKLNNNTYLNTQYNAERINKKILNVDSGSITDGDATDTYSLTLNEPFRIEKKSDIYLDSFTTFNCEANSAVNKIGFLLSIDQFNNNNSYSNLDNAHNKVFIPNEATEISKTYVHKGKKLNYVGSINPCELTVLDITINDLNNSTILNDGGARFILELIFIESE